MKPSNLCNNRGVIPIPLHGHLNSQSLPRNHESQIYQDILRPSPMTQGHFSKRSAAVSRATGDLTMLPQEQCRSSFQHHPPLERMTDSNSLVPLSLLLCNVWLMTCFRDRICLPLSGEAAPKPGL